MPSGIQVWDASGNKVFDSTVAIGGTVAGAYVYGPGTATLTFPQFAGLTPRVNLLWCDGVDHGLTTDTALGYPRVNVLDRYCTRSFLVMVS